MGMLKKVATETIDGKRPRGRSRQRWRDTVKLGLRLCAPGIKTAGNSRRSNGPKRKI